MTRIERGEGMAKINGSALRKRGNCLEMSLLALELWGLISHRCVGGPRKWIEGYRKGAVGEVSRAFSDLEMWRGRVICSFLHCSLDPSGF